MADTEVASSSPWSVAWQWPLTAGMAIFACLVGFWLVLFLIVLNVVPVLLGRGWLSFRRMKSREEAASARTQGESVFVWHRFVAEDRYLWRRPSVLLPCLYACVALCYYGAQPAAIAVAYLTHSVGAINWFEVSMFCFSMTLLIAFIVAVALAIPFPEDSK